ncbi:complex I NDUFA9 subunit family protein [Psychromarinibacter sp. C21-152]|uniref:Complex I NDUFA9 subunit family protein n=1 Tax=Psychromarinibacter sediminicola TaxID=3033385 RepID=A0AAE3T9M0_9RHOB|nr:complex I NDUFA9 subunit family protein [Psychromarinibacter sediminicola]MDF0601149.1 complex I NDUFA9 subunit family protein [Psychromarinibacter sediminicola]
MSKLVTIFGGSGFIGRYIARRLARKGWRVRVACRRPETAGFVRTYGVVGQVEPIFCNIRDDDSVRGALHSADAVVNCVGTFDAKGKNNFDAIQHEGAARIARLAKEQSVARMVHISAIGADAESESGYARTKAEGEAAVLEHMPDAVILRPSVVFGPEDAFFNRFAKMTRISPFLPLFGAETRFQPVYVDDVAAAAVMGATGRAAPGVYELGGPEAASFRDLMKQMLSVIMRRRLVIGFPFWVGAIAGWMSDLMTSATLGVISGPVTGDQIKQLKADNVVSEDAHGFEALGISPTSMDAILPEYLWAYRPSGQYAAIKDSARDLRT